MQKTVPLDYYMEEVRQIYLCQSNFWEVIEYRVFCFITISKFCWFLCFWKLLYFKFYLLLFQSFKGILSNTPLFFLAFIYLFIYLFIYCILLTVTWLVPCYFTSPLDLDGHFTQPLMFLLFEIFNCAVELRLIKR